MIGWSFLSNSNAFLILFYIFLFIFIFDQFYSRLYYIFPPTFQYPLVFLTNFFYFHEIMAGVHWLIHYSRHSQALRINQINCI